MLAENAQCDHQCKQVLYNQDHHSIDIPNTHTHCDITSGETSYTETFEASELTDPDPEDEFP